LKAGNIAVRIILKTFRKVSACKIRRLRAGSILVEMIGGGVGEFQFDSAVVFLTRHSMRIRNCKSLLAILRNLVRTHE
jgi:hypothetical protein